MIENQFNNNRGRDKGTWSRYLYTLKSPVTRQKFTSIIARKIQLENINLKSMEDHIDLKIHKDIKQIC